MFIPYKSKDGAVTPWEYLPVSAITPKVGMALIQTGGNLAIATGTNVPTYISMVEKDSACAAGDIIPVIRVEKDVIYETTNKVTLHASDGLQVTATKTDGVAEVVDFDDVAAAGAGGKVYVRF